MCTVSNVSDYYYDRWRPLIPQTDPNTWMPYKPYQPTYPPNVLERFLPISTPPTRISQLEAEVKALKEALEKARKYDAEHNEPHCEQEEKIADLKKMGDILGVNLDFIAE